ncbi:MAG TPA: GNAT family N-acetyltransferase [Pararhizobium sp.]|nr:GNAT family N-acetyltransferase [Pararhizobium sp.]
MVIRKAHASESGRLAEIGFSAWQHAMASWGEDVAALSANARRAYETFVQDSWDIILVGEVDSAAAGWGAREGLRNQITDLWVQPEFQGQGIGSALLQALENEVDAAGFETIEIETHARNQRAIDLYRRRGYVVRALSVKYSAPLNRDIEKVELTKVLRS